MDVHVRTMTFRLTLLTAVAALGACAAPAAADSTLLPFPDDRHTVPAATPTGRQLALPQDEMPRNRLGRPIDVTDINRADGFSPGSAILVKVPGVDTIDDFRRLRMPPIDDPGRSLRRDSPVRVVDARTGRPHLVWAELDANPADPAERVLIIRPAKNFTEGARYVVHVEGLEPWRFTVASARSTTGRMLAIRDRAFAELGDANLADRKVAGRAPTWSVNPDLPDGLLEDTPEDLGAVDGIVDYTPEQDPRIARKVRGKLVVPCFLDAPGCPTGSQFRIGADGTPQRLPANTTVYDWTCNIPRREGPLRAGLYGHGLFGSQGEIDQGQLKDLSVEHGFLFCAIDWNGMSFKDVPNTATVLQDLSRFPTLVDHVQQGYLGFLLLGRAMIHPDGLSSHGAFKGQLDPGALYYDGNSQGGIYGGALTAIAPDFERAVLGVPGMNYSTLLHRSVDFDAYAQGDFGADTPLGLYDNYPDQGDHPLLFSIMQLLWDRADPNGFAAHMTSDPLPNTPAHKVLLHVGFGDHQVADVTTEVEARTIGARVHRPLLGPGRERYRDRPYPDAPAGEAFQGVRSLGAPGYAYDGSGVVFWDTGRTPPPWAANVPPRDGQDPHEYPRRTRAARVQKSAFLRPDGRIVDVCGGPCLAE
jgi:hypothetical protein